MTTLPPPATLAAEAGAQDSLDELLALRIHQVVLSALTVSPERAPFVALVVQRLAQQLGQAPPKPARRPRTTPGVAP
jgi:hypothetical protein